MVPLQGAFSDPSLKILSTIYLSFPAFISFARLFDYYAYPL